LGFVLVKQVLFPKAEAVVVECGNSRSVVFWRAGFCLPRLSAGSANQHLNPVHLKIRKNNSIPAIIYF
jgi:hypothetical protein